MVSLVTVTVAACSPAVNLGGPRPDAGPASGADASGPLEGLNQAKSYATGDVACATDDDCCVVFDGCVNQGLVVGVADKDKVASLLAEFDQAEGTAESQGTVKPMCTGCIPPTIQVGCVEKKCVGFDPFPHLQLPDGGHLDSTLMQSLMTNHCGSVSGAPAASGTGSVLGC
jgi:hypothetical protein